MPKSYKMIALQRMKKIVDLYAECEDKNGEALPDFFVRDLLTDLRHYCDRHGIDLGERDKAAHEVYLEELAEENPFHKLAAKGYGVVRGKKGG